MNSFKYILLNIFTMCYDFFSFKSLFINLSELSSFLFFIFIIFTMFPFTPHIKTL